MMTALDPEVPLDRVMPMTAYVGDALAQARLTLVLMAGFGVAALGLVAAPGLSRLIAGLLYGVNPSDPVTFAGMTVFLLTIASLGCYVPDRRATAVNPLAALKAE